MTITAKIIADSISPEGIRLTTMQLRYPRFIHAEFMTHRVFSRNASSSRAIPVERLIQDVLDDPAMPIHWGKNQKGMQAREELTDPHLTWAKEAWVRAQSAALSSAHNLQTSGAHKQIVNRLLEPFSHINVVVTATEWDNFFQLRRHPDAQPEIMALADAMWEAREGSEPIALGHNQWHLPYVTEDDYRVKGGSPFKVSVARCARVSYLTQEGRPTTVEEDLALYERLVSASPPHLSPTEHQATPDVWAEKRWDLWGNFRGWVQHRKMLEADLL